MSDVIAMTAEAKANAGKGAARATRREGKVPAIVYGGDADPVMVALESRLVVKTLNQGVFFSTMYDLKIGDKVERVLPRDVQLHPVTDIPQHIDFMRVTGATRVTVEVACHFINEDACEGLRRGGVLNIVRHEIEVECAVDNIPHAFEIDLAGFNINDSIHISHVTLPAGVVPTITDRDFTIATIAAPTVVAEEADEGESAQGKGTEEN